MTIVLIQLLACGLILLLVRTSRLRACARLRSRKGHRD